RPVVGNSGKQEMLARIGRGCDAQFRDSKPPALAAQRFHVRQPPARVGPKVEAKTYGHCEFPCLGTADRFESECAFGEAEEFPPFLISERPFGRVCVAVPIEATLVIVMEANARQFGSRYEKKQLLEIGQVTADFTVARLKLRHHTLVNVFQK